MSEQMQLASDDLKALRLLMSAIGDLDWQVKDGRLVDSTEKWAILQMSFEKQAIDRLPFIAEVLSKLPLILDMAEYGLSMIPNTEEPSDDDDFATRKEVKNLIAQAIEEHTVKRHSSFGGR